MEQADVLFGADETPETKYRDYFQIDFHSLPAALRPRERLIRRGAKFLSDQELLAIVLNSGIKGKPVSVLAQELLEKLERTRELPGVEDLEAMSGLGRHKACAIIAMLELGRRHWDVSGIKVLYPRDIFNLINHYANRKQERFITISLNGCHEVIAVRVVTVGLVNRTLVHPREVFSDPLADRCSAICVGHNHPSGDLTPSREDDDVTASLGAAAEVLGIRFLDHIIFSDKSFYSYRVDKKLKDQDRSNLSCAYYSG